MFSKQSICAQIFFCALLFQLGSGTPALSQDEKDDWVWNQSTRTEMDDFVGRTLHAVTASLDSIWSVYLSPTGIAEFVYQNGLTSSASYITDEGKICFTFGKTGSYQNICRRIEESGRGYKWISAEKSDPSSYIFYTENGNTALNLSPINRIPQWRGSIVVGITNKDKEIWRIKISDDLNYFDFIYGSGLLKHGKIQIKKDRLCFLFKTGKGDCKFTRVNKFGNFEWVSYENKKHISKIIAILNR